MTYMTGWGPRQLANGPRSIKITNRPVILFHLKKEDSIIFTLEKKKTHTPNIYYYDIRLIEHKDSLSYSLSNVHL